MPEDTDDLDDRIKLAQRGDSKALADLYDCYRTRVYRYAVLRLGRSCDAEDAVSETFERVLSSLRRFDVGRGSFASWLFGIARHVVGDHYRRAARRREVISDDMRVFDQPLAGVESSVRDEAVLELRQALSLLPEMQREVLLLRFGAELSAQEISKALGKSPGAVRIQQMRALQSLRDAYEMVAT